MLAWTVCNLGEPGVENIIGAHGTGIEPVSSFRRDLGLDRAHGEIRPRGGTPAGIGVLV